MTAISAIGAPSPSFPITAIPTALTMAVLLGRAITAQENFQRLTGEDGNAPNPDASPISSPE